MKIFVVELPLKRNEQILRRVQEVVNGLLVELRRDHAQVLDDGAESKPDFGHVANFNFGVELYPNLVPSNREKFDAASQIQPLL